MSEEPAILQLSECSIDDDGRIVLAMNGAAGELFALQLPTLECQSLIEALHINLTEALGVPKFESRACLPFERMQLAEIGETLYVRLFVSQQIYHEYSLPLRTTLAQAMIRALEAQNQSKVTHPGSGTPQ